MGNRPLRGSNDRGRSVSAFVARVAGATTSFESRVLRVIEAVGITLNLDPEGQSSIARDFENPTSQRPSGFVIDGTETAAIPGKALAANAFSVLQISGYDDILIRNNDIRGLTRNTITGELFRLNATGDTSYVEYPLLISGADSGEWVRIGKDSRDMAIASIKTAGTHTVLINGILSIRFSGGGQSSDLTARITSLEAFEALFREDNLIVNAVSVDTLLADQPYAIPGNPSVPANTPGSRLRVSVADFIGYGDISISDLLAKDSIEAQGTIAPLDDPDNAIKISLAPTNNPNTTQDFYICHNQAGQLLFGVRARGSKTLTITETAFDASEFISRFVPLLALPMATGVNLGTIINYRGTLYALTPSTAANNVISGVVDDIPRSPPLEPQYRSLHPTSIPRYP